MILSEGITADYTLYNTREMLEENSNMIFIANVFSYTFIVMISLIAVANVFNTISTNIKLRKKRACHAPVGGNVGTRFSEDDEL